MSSRQPLLFEDNAGVSGLLTDSEIRKAVESHWLISNDTFIESSVEPSSYDVSIGAKGVIGGFGTEIDLRTQTMELGPGAYAGVISHEKFILSDRICARIGSKRALSYDGIILLTGSTIDPGYEGRLLFCLYNASQRKVFIRSGKKICNVVFERLAKLPDTVAKPSDSSLRTGSFPDAFLDRMANMEVLPWVQINERVKQIETITKDIIDLKARYEDVLQPIRDLTSNVQKLSDDVNHVNSLVSENSKQIQQLTTNLTSMTVSLQTVQERNKFFEESDRTQSEAISSLKTEVSRFQTPIRIIWAILLVVLGAMLSYAIPKLLQRPSPPAQSNPVTAPQAR